MKQISLNRAIPGDRVQIILEQNNYYICPRFPLNNHLGIHTQF